MNFNDKELIDKLKKQYDWMHPLVFHRSVERAINSSNLFEILESVPKSGIFVWDELKSCWGVTKDLTRSKNFDKDLTVYINLLDDSINEIL